MAVNGLLGGAGGGADDLEDRRGVPSPATIRDIDRARRTMLWLD